MTDSPDVTTLMERARQGNAQAAADLLPIVYEQLRASAAKGMASERADHTLQPTALVHEAYLRLVGSAPVAWEGRAHFYAAAAEAMRRVLIDYARARKRTKRGGDWQRVTLDGLDPAEKATPIEEIVSVDQAIRRMEVRDPRMAQIVRLRFFAGLEVRDVAQALGITDRTVRRDWAVARAWLYRALSEERGPDDADPDAPPGPRGSE
ncbi:sigma-70 family RNA polymerase sigma factor [bacterium]|nr:sigma-70 family RNA polymerase sigma factor [bacterium]